MKAKDLRIGLWVYLFGDAVQLTADHLIYLYQKKGLPEPITLTEEWLLKFGFERVSTSEFKNHQMPYWAKNAVILFYNDSPPFNTYLACQGEYISDFKGGGEYFATGRLWIDTVHQLQNLYFALTGEELTINSEYNKQKTI